jgi:serine protease inhibitor
MSLKLLKALLIFSFPTLVIVPGTVLCNSESENSNQISDVSASLNSFAFDLYNELSSARGNIFISPFSIASALSMTLSGADGKTAEEIASVLHFSDLSNGLHETLSQLTSSIQQVTSADVNVANSLFPSTTFPLEESYTSLLKSLYNTEITSLDYGSTTDESRIHINNWVKMQTNAKIRELLAPGTLDPLTVMVLANAIYFKADWRYQFDEKKTTNKPFKSHTGEIQTVPTMFQEHSFNFYKSDKLKLLELPYKDDQFSMIFILPDKSIELNVIENDINIAELSTLMDKMRPVDVSVQIPRFHIEWGATDLTHVLQELGMQKAFTSYADFSAMSKREGIYVNMVVHKAFVEVNEDGAEAAAATAVVMRLTSMPQQFQFIANRPFLFLIRDMKTNVILFMGRVSEI